MRLNKYLSESGSWSRRGADAIIEARRVTINGVVAGLGTQVAAGDVVKVDGAVVGAARKLERPVYIALNKPVGITCTTERHVEGNIIDFVDHEERIFPIGRLDKDSQGLILLTNDGDIVNEVLRAEHGHEKEYVVTVDHPVSDEFVARMAGGVQLSDALTKRCKVRRLGARVFNIILTQGLNRQIRRMCAALGYEVVALERIRIMHVTLGNLPIGKWRDLSAAEVAALWPTTPRGPQAPPAPQASGRPGAGPARQPSTGAAPRSSYGPHRKRR
jgi:23S rRNA pseudouridine2604 synthase